MQITRKAVQIDLGLRVIAWVIFSVLVGTVISFTVTTIDGIPISQSFVRNYFINMAFAGPMMMIALILPKGDQSFWTKMKAVALAAVSVLLMAYLSYEEYMTLSTMNASIAMVFQLVGFCLVSGIVKIVNFAILIVKKAEPIIWVSFLIILAKFSVPTLLLAFLVGGLRLNIWVEAHDSLD